MKRVLAMLLAVVSSLAALPEATSAATGVQTNWVDRWITNTSEIQMQRNRFVTEFHTNWLTQARTNFVDLFATNIVTKTITNTFVLDEVQTNFVRAFQTNLKTLNLTNWTTVVVFRTNWITKPLTNLVDIEMTREGAPAALPVARAAINTEPLSLQASRSARLGTNNQVEVQIAVTWTKPPAIPVQVQQWRIEREDGSILCFGQEPEFRRSLPVGRYKVLVKAQRDSKSPLLAALGTLTVTSHEVVLEQKPARSNSSS